MISMHTMAVDSFAPMLESLATWIRKGEGHAQANGLDLLNARLAPDMFTLTQQVQQACFYAHDAISRLTGQGAGPKETAETTYAGLLAQVARTIAALRAVSASAFTGAEARDCSIDVPDGGMVIAMDGLQYLRAWALPHFYFHVVTAYDILRHHGVEIGKRDYLSQVAAFIRPRR